MRFQATCYRGHDPKWAFTPLSGDGAKLHGGRFNPIGQQALYLSLSINTMLLEQQYGLARRFQPLTVCCYEIDCDDVVDLRTDASCKAAGVKIGDLESAWKLDLDDGREPSSWAVAKRLIASGAAGVLVPSFATGADRNADHNLVLWNWGPDLPHQVTAYDPSGKLPKNQLSWEQS